MQLILDSENTSDINNKMVSLDGGSLDEKLAVTIPDLNSEITNGNKENIKDQINIIAESEEISNIEDDDKEERSQALISEAIKDVENSLQDEPEENHKITEEEVIQNEDLNNSNKTVKENGTRVAEVESKNSDTVNGNDKQDVDCTVTDCIEEETSTVENNVDDDNTKNDAKICDNAESEVESKTNADGNENSKQHCIRGRTTDKEEEIEMVKKVDDADTENDAKTCENADLEVESESNDNVNETDKQDEDCIVTDYKEGEISTVEKNVEDVVTEEDVNTCENDDSNILAKESEQKTSIDEDKSESKTEEFIHETVEVMDDDKPPEDENIEKSSDSQVVPMEDKDEDVIMENKLDNKENAEETCVIEDDIVCVNLDADSADSTNNKDTESKPQDDVMDCDEVTEVDASDEQIVTTSTQPVECEVNTDEDLKIVDDVEIKQKEEIKQPVEKVPEIVASEKKVPSICKLSNTLDILSDDDEEETQLPKPESQTENLNKPEKQCIEVEDDDDIMLIDEEDTGKEVKKNDDSKVETENANSEPKLDQDKQESDNVAIDDKKPVEVTTPTIEQEPVKKDTIDCPQSPKISEKTIETPKEKLADEKPLLTENFLKTCKKNFADMTRNDLEEFCVLKIVESIVDRSNLSEIKTKLKNLTQNLEEFKKKTLMLTKQNRDLQVVLKSIQEEQKKATDAPVTPLKITRSVGMQVLITEKNLKRKSGNLTSNNVNNTQSRPGRPPTNPSPRMQKPANNSQPIPVPRLVPANSPASKSPATPTNNSNAGKTVSPMPNGVKNSPTQKSAEKRPLNRLQSVTVDLTDDEPPVKAAKTTQPTPPVRLVPQQNLLAPQRPQFSQSVNSPRKVYIPISGPQGQVRPGQTIMLKTVPSPGPRQRCPTPQMVRLPQNPVRITRTQNTRHPAPLPEVMKQYQPPNWKDLPPAPDLKLSKVENGIVISWKIDSYQEDSYEEIASYQLYAYQETQSPPSTALWKKIGDVKALPLPMACTLTQFMAGFKYYFAVRAVDVRSRLGPFSLPGSILLLNKM